MSSRDRREVLYWTLAVKRLCDALGAKLDLPDGTGMDILLQHYASQISVWLQQATLLREGRFDLLHDAHGWYTEQEVQYAMATI